MKQLLSPKQLAKAKGAIEPLLPVPKNSHGGRPRRVSLRDVINAILYLNRAGCQWDLLPHDFPPKSTVYDGLRRSFNLAGRRNMADHCVRAANTKSGD